MIHIVEAPDYERHADLMSGMFQLRASIFGEKLNWQVDVVDGMERDKYDSEDPVYLIHAAGPYVRGSLRLLPTTGPTLLHDVFAVSIPAGALLMAPTIWECTRFCVAADDLRVAGEMLAALGRLSLQKGIETILGNFDPAMLRVYRRIGCDVEILGSIPESAGPQIHLGAFHVSEAHLARIEARLAGNGRRT